MAKQSKNCLFGSQADVSISEPVECFEVAFKSNKYRRAHFTDLLRAKLKDPAFRKAEGFPIGEDDDILGMLSVPSYKEAWERKRQWYDDNGFLGCVITSEDGLDGSIDAAEIERIARKKIPFAE